MRQAIRSYIAICLHPEHLKRTLTITAIVGTWLTLFNQGDILLSTGVTAALATKVLFNYVTPFVVSNWGLISRKPDNVD